MTIDLSKYADAELVEEKKKPLTEDDLNQYQDAQPVADLADPAFHESLPTSFPGPSPRDRVLRQVEKQISKRMMENAGYTPPQPVLAPRDHGEDLPEGTVKNLSAGFSQWMLDDTYVSDQSASYLTQLWDAIPARLRGAGEFARQITDSYVAETAKEYFGLDAFDDWIGKSKELRDYHRQQVEKASLEKGGKFGRLIQEATEVAEEAGVNLLLMRALRIPYGGESNIGRTLVTAPIRAGMMAMSAEGATLEDRARSFALGTLYQSTPALSSLAKTDWLAISSDIALNSAITIPQWSSMVDNAYERANAEGKPELAGLYIMLEAGHAHVTDVVFGAQTRSLRIRSDFDGVSQLQRMRRHVASATSKRSGALQDFERVLKNPDFAKQLEQRKQMLNDAGLPRPFDAMRADVRIGPQMDAQADLDRDMTEHTASNLLAGPSSRLGLEAKEGAPDAVVTKLVDDVVQDTGRPAEPTVKAEEVIQKKQTTQEALEDLESQRKARMQKVAEPPSEPVAGARSQDAINTLMETRRAQMQKIVGPEAKPVEAEEPGGTPPTKENEQGLPPIDTKDGTTPRSADQKPIVLTDEKQPAIEARPEGDPGEEPARPATKEPVYFEDVREIDLGDGVRAEKTSSTTWKVSDRDGEPFTLDEANPKDAGAIADIRQRTLDQLDKTDPAGKQARLQADINRTTKTIKAVEVELVEKQNQLPKHILDRARAQAQGKEGPIEGVWDEETGKVFVVSEHIGSSDATRVVLHETVGHAGVRGVLGKRLPDVMKQVYGAMNDQAVSDIAKRYGLDGTNSADRMIIAEEALAQIAERRIDDPGMWKKAVASVRDALRKVGFVGTMTDNDIQVLLLKAQKKVESRRPLRKPSFKIGKGPDNVRFAFSDAKLEVAEETGGKFKKREQAVIEGLKYISELDRSAGKAYPSRKTVHKINQYLKDNPEGRKELQAIAERTKIPFLDDEGYFKPIPIEEVMKTDYARVVMEAEADITPLSNKEIVAIAKKDKLTWDSTKKFVKNQIITESIRDQLKELGLDPKGARTVIATRLAKALKVGNDHKQMLKDEEAKLNDLTDAKLMAQARQNQEVYDRIGKRIKSGMVRGKIEAQLRELGLSTKGSRDDLARRVGEQFGYETPKYGGFARSASQMFMDAIPDKLFESIRGRLVQATEQAFEVARYEDRSLSGPWSKIVGYDKKGLTLSKIEEEELDFRVVTPIREAHKTVGALNLNSACPMFYVGNSGCWGDACYVTQQGAGSMSIRLFERAMYTGEILQMSRAEVARMNKIGGLRLNGVGDTDARMLPQFRDIMRHANKVNLSLKVITKQAVTFKIMDQLAKEGIDMHSIVVQPSIDPWWMPMADDLKPGSRASDLKIGVLLAKGKNKEAIALYKKEFGRDAKIIDGVAYRKFGFSYKQIQDLQKKYPGAKIRPRTVVSTVQEIVDSALNQPGTIITLMHGKLPGNMKSDIGGDLLDFGNARHHIQKDSKGQWHFRAEIHAKDGTVSVIDTKQSKALDDYIRKSGLFTKSQQDLIFKRLRSATCCQSGDSMDACADCQGHCAQNRPINKTVNLKQTVPREKLFKDGDPEIREGVTRLSRKDDKGRKPEWSKLPTDPRDLSDSTLERISAFMKKAGYDSRGGADARQFLTEEYDLNRSVNSDWLEAYDRATGNYERETKPASTENINRDRLAELGTTEDWREAGYITTNGKMLDLSGKNEGGPGGSRAYDHREAGGTAGMQEFMAEGNIRYMPEANGFDLLAKPSSAQIKTIKDIILSRPDERIYLDMEDGLGRWSSGNKFYSPSMVKDGRDFPAGTDPKAIIRIINRFYADAEKEVRLSVSGRYSTDDRDADLERVETPERYAELYRKYGPPNEMSGGRRRFIDDDNGKDVAIAERQSFPPRKVHVPTDAPYQIGDRVEYVVDGAIKTGAVSGYVKGSDNLAISAGDGRTFVVKNSDIKDQVSISTVGMSSSDRDMEYLRLVDEGKEAGAQKLVEAEAKGWGYDSPKVYHGSPEKFSVFDGDNRLHWFTDSKDYAETMGYPTYREPTKAFLRISNPARDSDVMDVAKEVGLRDDVLLDEFGAKVLEMSPAIRDGLMNRGFDGAIVDDLGDGGETIKSYVAFDPSQIKSADTVTRDDAGDIIPLSERFDPDTPDIRFSRQTPNPHSNKSGRQIMAELGRDKTVEEVESRALEMERRNLVEDVTTYRKFASKIKGFFDTEERFRELGADETGFRVKNLFSQMNSGAEKALKIRGDLLGMMEKDSDQYDVLFGASSEKYMDTLDTATRERLKPIVAEVRRIMDGYEQDLKDWGVIEQGWPYSRIDLIEKEVEWLENKKARIAEGKFDPTISMTLKQGTINGKPLKMSAKLRTQMAEGLDKLMTSKDTKKEAFKLSIEIIDQQLTQHRADIERLQAMKHVHLPMRMWLNDKFESDPDSFRQILSGNFKALQGRKTIDPFDLVKSGLLAKDKISILDSMGVYIRYVENQRAQQLVRVAGEQDGIVIDAGLAPRNWVEMDPRKYPLFAGAKMHPAYAEALEQHFGYLDHRAGPVQRLLSTTKMLQFYNPIIMPMYDTLQGIGATSGESLFHYRQGFKSVTAKDADYFEASENGAFSSPSPELFQNFMRDMLVQDYRGGNFRLNKMHKDIAYNLKETFIAEANTKTGKAVKSVALAGPKAVMGIYRASWQSAWMMDKGLRMATYKTFKRRGYSAREAGRLTAEAHADYASVPPGTRKLLNVPFFTPTFQLAMLKWHAKNAGSTVRLAGELVGKPLGLSKGEHIKMDTARALTFGTNVGLLMGTHALFVNILGFTMDQFGRKYHKKVLDDNGEEKEAVITLSNPINVPIKWWYAFAVKDPGETQLQHMMASGTYFLHPFWRTGMALYANERSDGTPITHTSSGAGTQLIEGSLYFAGETLKLAKGWIDEPDETKMKALGTLVKNEENPFLWALRPFTFAYMRNPGPKRQAYKARHLTNTFYNEFWGRPPKTVRQLEIMYDNLERALNQLLRESHDDDNREIIEKQKLKAVIGREEARRLFSDDGRLSDDDLEEIREAIKQKRKARVKWTL